MIEVKENVYDVIRKNIKYYRKKRNMTQAVFAEKMGLSHDYIRQVESSKSGKHFSMGSIQTAAEVLDVELYMLFKDDLD
ncbi:MAG: helix-turn-helix transcriptional regulator [Firmicutes bacterium]|nr:helix-turn-helix transcriptional regulator [Bacillota bacterium]